MCVCVCVRACVRAYACVYVRACVLARKLIGACACVWCLCVNVRAFGDCINSHTRVSLRCVRSGAVTAVLLLGVFATVGADSKYSHNVLPADQWRRCGTNNR